MPNKSGLKSISLRKLRISNFKGLDFFEIEFPRPRMKNDPDIFVLGSKNGLGKTSVLEACALLFLYALSGNKSLFTGIYRDLPIDIIELLIRAGEQESQIEGYYLLGNKAFLEGKEEIYFCLKINRYGYPELSGDLEKFKKLRKEFSVEFDEQVQHLLFSLTGLNSEPFLLPGLMYFHSYRKVREGNPELGMMVKREKMFHRQNFRLGYEYPISTFKIEILRSLMGQANLFETPDNEESSEVLEKLNELIKRYAGGTIGKLRPLSDNTIDFRIIPTTGGESFTFDGLSSGQKEIISTLFLIWHYSRSINGIVLIDEPELHLNPEWHRDFVKQVTNLVPGNQYIIATHSEDIFASVPEDRRAFLVGK